MASPLTPPPLGSGTTADTGLPSNVAAGLCALFPLLGGVIFYFIEKTDALVRHWAVESILFGAAWFAFHLIVSILVMLFAPIPGLHLVLLPLVVLASLLINLTLTVLWVIWIIQAFQGRRWG